jgi:hypothetical protein
LFKQQERSRDFLSTKGAKIDTFSEPAAFFLWLEDDEEAIFAFKNVGNSERGLSFKTQDANLIRQFKDIFERRWKKLQDEHTPAPSLAPIHQSANPLTEIEKDKNTATPGQVAAMDNNKATKGQVVPKDKITATVDQEAPHQGGS